LGFDVKGEYPYKNTKWVEVAPKNSTTTISLMEPNNDMMTNEEIEQAKKEIGTMTNLICVYTLCHGLIHRYRNMVF
jgi:predicted HNH restriction endonuclease